MLIHWQSHQEYLHFLYETKVHLDSSQRVRLRLEFGSIREKLRLPDLDPVMEFLSGFFSHLGRPAKNQTQILRSLILMMMTGFTSLTAWVKKLNPNEQYTVYEADVPDETPIDEDEDILNYDDLDDPDAFV